MKNYHTPHLYLRALDPECNDSLAKIARWVRHASIVLDIGCGPGILGRHLAETLGCQVDGVEHNPEAARLAAPWYRQMVIADLEQAYLPELFSARQYDYIICADILEHLRNPERILVQAATLLAAHGRLLLSIPNVAYAGLIAELLTGEFCYRSEGLLDETHLRFFTRQSLERWLIAHGFAVCRQDSVTLDLASSEFHDRLDGLPSLLQQALLAQPDALTYQLLVEARVASAVNEVAPPAPALLVDVIIPVYRGLAETRACLSSVLHNRQSVPHEIIVIDDASPEPALTDYLRELAAAGRITLLRNEQNLGFVQTVNRGMALHEERDVVLLNSDTEVTGDWLDRLRTCAYRDAQTGTVTPFSNNATICSYPQTCADNALPPGYTVETLDALFRRVNVGRSVSIPTAVGFCMYIRRDCLREIGAFDAVHFGRGYGEENDFCMRATALGWRHLLCGDVFVYHRGSVSFDDPDNLLERQGTATVRRLHPGYDIAVQTHIAADPAKPLRQAVDAARLLSSNLPVVLFINHNLGGGTLKHVRELAALLSTQMQTLLLCPTADNIHTLRWLREGESLELRFALPGDYALLSEVLRALGVARIHFHHLFGVDPCVRELPGELGVPHDYTLHDYYPICPRINLFNTRQGYCQEPDAAGCNDCLQTTLPAISKTTIQEWRAGHAQQLKAADRVLTPTQDVLQRMRRYLPEANLIFAPHADTAQRQQPLAPVRLTGNEPLRIVVVGALNQIKGADILEACAIEAGRRNLPLTFHLVGYAQQRNLAVEPHSRLHIHGAYDDKDLPERLAALHPHLAWFPAQWPETYCYALSACLRAGLPVVATDLGALRERLAGRPWSWIQPWQTRPTAWNDFFVNLRKQHFARGVAPPPQPGTRPVAEFDYPHDYLRPLTKVPDSPAYIPDDLADLLGACAAVPPTTAFDYNAWLRRHRWDDLACRHMLKITENRAMLPLIHLFIVLPASQSALLGSTLISLARQTLAAWRLTVIADFACPSPEFAEMDELSWVHLSAGRQLSEALREQAQQSPAEWFWCGPAGLQLEPVFTNLAVELISRHPEWRLVYTDEDVVELQPDGESWSRPLFKPDANLDLLRSSGYVGHAVLIHRELWGSLPAAELRPGLLLNYAAALRCFEQFGEAAVGHIDEMVFHRPETPSVDWPAFGRDALPLLSAHLQRQHLAATISAGPLPGTFQISYPLTQIPLISIIIPTRNRLDLIQPCLDSLLAKTRYPHFEVLVMDNGSDEPAVLDYLQQQSQQDSRLRVIPWPHPYNYSAINNHAAHLAQGEFLLLLNNDTVILHDDWLEILTAIGLRPDVGAVGCRLIYPNHTVQHAGVIGGLGGIVDHIGVGLPLGKPGYMGRAQLTQNFSAVTAACLLVRKETFFTAGGFDDSHFVVWYNDVDLCLKLVERGYRVVWSPAATLIHHGSGTLHAAVESRQPERLQEQYALVEKWRTRLARDPAYNRHLSLRYRTWRLDDAMDAPWHPEFEPLPRVVALPCDNAGVGHYRTSGPVGELTRQGHIRSLLLPDGRNPRWFMPASIELTRIRAKVLLLQNAFTDRHLAALETYAQLSPDVFKVFGLDDLVFALPPGNPARQHLGKDIKTRLQRGLSQCDRAVVTSEPIAEALRGMIADIRVAPNYLDRSRWTGLNVPHRERRKPRVGWAGGIHHADDLALLQPVIEATAAEVDWVFMGLCLEQARPWVAEIHPGVPFDDYPAALAALDLDLAVAPLQLNRFNQAKSNLRLLEYGALGWPVVCTDILPYQHAPATRVPNKAAAWIRAIREHINDPEASNAAGVKLQNWVLNHWMLDQHLDKWLSAILPDRPNNFSE